MKNVLKFGFLALIVGMFAVSCGNGANSGSSTDSSATMEDTSSMMTPAPAPAPDTTPAAPDSNNVQK